MSKPIPKYFEKLKEIAPSIVFSVELREETGFLQESWKDEWGEQGNLESCLAVITAKAIFQGREYNDHAYLSGCWEDPEDSDISLGGYLPQKIEEAAKDLKEQLPEGAQQRVELGRVIFFMMEVMKEEWERQQKEKT